MGHSSKTVSTRAQVTNFLLLANCLLAMAATLGSCGHTADYYHRGQDGSSSSSSSGNMKQNQPRNSANYLARRSIVEDLARPLTRLTASASSIHQQESMPASIVMGKFKAPAPDKIYKARMAKSSNFGEQTMSASYQVMDNNDNIDGQEKIVNGVIGASALNKRTAQQQQQQQPRERKVGAKMQVSDEGLNYPPSKLSADIYGNVAEIVTAPPEAVDNDFLVPQVSQMFGQRRP